MDGHFASNGPVWRQGEFLELGADLSALTRDTLERMYNIEMRRVGGRSLSSTWQKKPKEALVDLVRELVRDLAREEAQLVMPPTLNESSRPTLAKGTRLRARVPRGDRHYAIVHSETPAGKLRLNVYATETVAHTLLDAGRSETRCRRGALNRYTLFAQFEPSTSPDSINAHATGDYWTLYTKDKAFGYLSWELEPADEGPDVVVEWTVQHDAN